MDYTQLGRSGTAVSRICLGTMNFGAITSEADSHQIMDLATGQMKTSRIAEGVNQGMDFGAQSTA